MEDRRRRREGRLLLAPFTVGVVLLLLVPLALNVRYAFTNHTGLGEPVFNGLDNLRRARADPFLADSLRASLAYVVLAVPLRLLAAIGLGLMLARPRRGNRLYRAAVFVPTVVPEVALALLFLWLLNPVFGPVGRGLALVGVEQLNWFAHPWGARAAIALMMAFPVGEALLVVLAARLSLPRELYDAAAVDGAGARQQLFRITLPLLAPLLVLLAVRDTILTLQVNVVPAYLLTDGAPDNATLFLPVYIFDQAFEFLGFGYGAFLTLLLLAITATIVGLQALLAWRGGWLRP